MDQLNDATPQRFERYELLAELASGGMATVFLARLGGAGGFQRLYAIKRLHPHLAKEQEFIDMFLDEARLAARIHHPNVVPILEVGQSQQGYFLVMEYIEGETLARLLGRMASRKKRIPLRIGMKILLDALAGLEAAHGLHDDFGKPLNIVHRDVSPQNIMVGADGTSRITDFGVARATTKLNTTREGQLKGKLGYMAPEQARGEEIDQRADVFSVGVILWETLEGLRLFKGKADTSEAQTLNRLLYEPIAELQQADPRVIKVLGPVCDQALERIRDRRFDSCGVFADAIESAMKSLGGIASPKEVAAFVDSVAGPEIESQRSIVRSWASRSGVNIIEKADSESFSEHHTSPFELGTPVSQSGQKQTLVENRKLAAGGVGAVLLGLLIGGIAVYLMNEPSDDPQGALTTEASASAPPALSPQPSHLPTPRPIESEPEASTEPSAQPTTPPSMAPAQPTRRTPGKDGKAAPTPPAHVSAEKPPSQPESSKPTQEPSDDLSTNPYRH